MTKEGSMGKNCICPKKCDCQNPPPKEGYDKSVVYGVSNHCPEHNLNPWPDPDCLAHD
jgi:hypothetical protein